MLWATARIFSADRTAFVVAPFSPGAATLLGPNAKRKAFCVWVKISFKDEGMWRVAIFTKVEAGMTFEREEAPTAAVAPAPMATTGLSAKIHFFPPLLRNSPSSKVGVGKDGVRLVLHWEVTELAIVRDRVFQQHLAGIIKGDPQTLDGDLKRVNFRENSVVDIFALVDVVEHFLSGGQCHFHRRDFDEYVVQVHQQWVHGFCKLGDRVIVFRPDIILAFRDDNNFTIRDWTASVAIWKALDDNETFAGLPIFPEAKPLGCSPNGLWKPVAPKFRDSLSSKSRSHSLVLQFTKGDSRIKNEAPTSSAAFLAAVKWPLKLTPKISLSTRFPATSSYFSRLTLTSKTDVGTLSSSKHLSSSFDPFLQSFSNFSRASGLLEGPTWTTTASGLTSRIRYSASRADLSDRFWAERT
ncbi:spindle and centriole-associated protein 1 [Striga asiatica]|uniref:Spindle and centriole-associated protein 1 n=1 Tax=Striga asiatica TaxID=4170 RepID=A0A5A7PG48_STRAF|nr:spindle and centriole-associated protein 1 [Striga asiatica]